MDVNLSSKSPFIAVVDVQTPDDLNSYHHANFTLPSGMRVKLDFPPETPSFDAIVGIGKIAVEVFEENGSIQVDYHTLAS